MPEETPRALHNEQAEPQPIRAGWVDPVKGLENPRDFVGRNADTVIPHLDAYRGAAPPAGHQDATAARRIVDRVAYQISQDTAQQAVVAENGSADREDAKLYPVRPRGIVEFSRHARE